MNRTITSREELSQWAMSADVSDEVASIIQGLADGDEERMNYIWQNPTCYQERDILEAAFEILDADSNLLYWGGEHRRSDYTDAEEVCSHLDAEETSWH